MMTVAFLWPLVLVSAFVYDLAITRYVVAVENRRGWRAGAWSVLTYLVGLVGTLGIVKISPWLILPECIGLLLGTVLGVSMKDKEEDESCPKGAHLDPCDDEECWSNSPQAARVRMKIGWYDQ